MMVCVLLFLTDEGQQARAPVDWLAEAESMEDGVKWILPHLVGDTELLDGDLHQNLWKAVRHSLKESTWRHYSMWGKRWLRRG